MSYTSYNIVGATPSYFKKLQGILVMDHRPNNNNYEVCATAKCFFKDLEASQICMGEHRIGSDNFKG